MPRGRTLRAVGGLWHCVAWHLQARAFGIAWRGIYKHGPGPPPCTSGVTPMRGGGGDRAGYGCWHMHYSLPYVLHSGTQPTHLHYTVPALCQRTYTTLHYTALHCACSTPISHEAREADVYSVDATDAQGVWEVGPCRPWLMDVVRCAAHPIPPAGLGLTAMAACARHGCMESMVVNQWDRWCMDSVTRCCSHASDGESVTSLSRVAV